jgi:hypothetical protein
LQGFPDWTLRSNIGREYDSGACPVRRGFPCPFGHLGRGRSNHGQVRAEFEVIERRHAWSVIDDLVPRIDETDVPGKTGAKYITRKEQAGRSFSRARPEDCQGPRLEEALYRLVAQGQGVQLSKACINNARIPTGFPSAPASIAGDEGKLQAYDLVASTSMQRNFAAHGRADDCLKRRGPTPPEDRPGFGLPVSTTHVLSSGVAGTMAANGSGIQLGTIRNIAMAWILTLPCAIALSATLFFIFRHIF